MGPGLGRRADHAFEDQDRDLLGGGEVVVADPENWLISDGKLYVFGKAPPFGPAMFQQDLSANIAKANQNRAILPKD